MSKEKVTTGYERVTKICSIFEDESETLIMFNTDNIDKFITKIEQCKTVRKVIDSTDIDELNYCLTQIDIYYNSQFISKKLKNILQSVTSNFSMDYLKEMSSVLVVGDKNV